MRISMIVAHGPHGEIGLDNKLLWHISEDLKHFKKITTGKIILMGRKTFESIGRPLPNRTNVVLTRDENFRPSGVEIINNPEMFFDFVLNRELEEDEHEVIICGGAEVYKIFLPYTQTLYRTLVDYSGDADAFFPEIVENEWEIESNENHEGFKFQTLKKI